MCVLIYHLQETVYSEKKDLENGLVDIPWWLGIFRSVSQETFRNDYHGIQTLTFIVTRPLSSRLKSPNLSRISLHVELT